MKKHILFNFKNLTLSILSFTLFIFINSCKKTSEKATEKMIEKSIGNDANVDIDDEKVTIKTEEGTFTTDANTNSWPDNISNDIPEFKYGEIISVTTQEMDEGNGWMIIFEEVSKTALSDYQTELKKKGFKITNMTTYGTGGMISAHKDKLIVTIISGDDNATVSVSAEK